MAGKVRLSTDVPLAGNMGASQERGVRICSAELMQ